MTVIYNMSIDRADKPWIGDRRLTEDDSKGTSERPLDDREDESHKKYPGSR